MVEGQWLAHLLLSDNVWLHGSTEADIVLSVANGVPDKGMLAWASIVGMDSVRDVASYVHELGGGQ